MTLMLLVAFAATMMLSVDRIFGWLTPVAQRDLQWKINRGVAELGRTADFPILLRDPALIREAAKDYEADGEVRLFEARDADDVVVYRHDKGGATPALLFRGDARKVTEQRDHLWSWTPVEVEGERVGRIALAVSTARVKAGEKLRGEILQAALVAGVIGIALSLLFVSLYVRPLIAVTKRTFLELERKTVEALEATRVKSEFLANMSHEIRTPLNGVIGMLGLLMRGELSARQRRRAEISESSARSLLALINDVLDFSKLEAGHHVLHPTVCDLRTLVRNRVELLAVKAHTKQLEIAYRFDEAVPEHVMVDGDRLTQVLTNLVGNAIKFTQDGDVVVSVTLASANPETSEAAIRFEVRDTGAGIAPADQARLFKSFSQVDASLTRAHEGTGLGLAISKHLVELMGGAIGVESELGKGATFWFTVSCGVLAQARVERARAGSPEGRQILIVDPNEMYRKMLAEYMVRWGMRATLVASSAEAVASARTAASAGAPFEFAIIDSRLQDERGQSLATTLRNECGGKLSVIQMTPALWTPTEREAVEPSAFLAKPVRASDLYDCIVTQTAEPGTAQTRARTTALGARRGHILVVDDNEVNRVLAEELLRDLQHTCDLAAGGREAIEYASSRVYDAVLMDCQMPDMNGYQATHEIRERERDGRRRTPIIALTAHAFTGEAAKVKAAGMDDFLSKPVTPQVLDATLQKWMVVASTGRIRSMANRLEPVQDIDASPANDIADVRAEDGDPAAGQPVLIDQRRSPRLLQTFLRNVPEQVKALVSAAGTDDLQTLRGHAHKLKGSAASIGAIRLSKLCEAIQFAADRGDSTDLQAWSKLVEGALAQLTERLEAELVQKRAD